MLYYLIKPWEKVKWVYCERDNFGVRLLIEEGTCPAYKAIIAYALVCMCNVFIKKCGAEHYASDFLICDV